MLAQRLLTLMDNLAGIWIPHNFRVSVVPAVLSLLPVHPLLAVARPTRLRHGCQPRLPAWLACTLTPALTSGTDVISTPNLRACEPQSGQEIRSPAGVLGGSSSCLPHPPHHTVCFTVTTPILQKASPSHPDGRKTVASQRCEVGVCRARLRRAAVLYPSSLPRPLLLSYSLYF
jgi:hypothetical protein